MRERIRFKLVSLCMSVPFIKSIGVVIYRLINLVVVLGFKIFKLTIYPRNSYCFKLITPGLSDIDYSLIINDEEDIKWGIQLYSVFKKLFLVIGELNIIDNFVISNIEMMNYYEASRDPVLGKIKKSHICLEEKSVFLSRMLISDTHLQGEYRDFRKNKWVFHLKTVCGVDVHPEDKIEKIVSDIKKNIIAVEEVERLFCCKTVAWMSDALEIGRYGDALLEASGFSKQSHKIAFYQVAWEVFGCWQQRHSLPKQQLTNHLNNLKMLLDVLTIELDRKYKLRSILEKALLKLEA